MKVKEVSGNREAVKMKLLTYNFLTSKCIRGVKVGYPLKLHVQEKKEVQAEFSPEFITKTLPRLEWPAIYAAAQVMNCSENLPQELSESMTQDQDFLKQVHHVLLEIDIVKGNLECPETGRLFPITDGIPNMLLNEHEV
uniref:Multifunctional methyltransferase subunit TRM112-like protein n=2 Tax=Culicoides sonorensis TaxID=179676 RepID=A0A336N417_CULSO